MRERGQGAALGRIEEADEIVDILDRNGRRVDRPWMLAVAGRCRAMSLAARGDVAAAEAAAQAAAKAEAEAKAAGKKY